METIMIIVRFLWWSFKVLTLQDILHKHSGYEKTMGSTGSPKSEFGEFWHTYIEVCWNTLRILTYLLDKMQPGKHKLDQWIKILWLGNTAVLCPAFSQQ